MEYLILSIDLESEARRNHLKEQDLGDALARLEGDRSLTRDGFASAEATTEAAALGITQLIDASQLGMLQIELQQAELDAADSEAESEVSRRTRVQQFLADSHTVYVESKLEDMLEYLASVWVTSKLFEVFEDSKLAEFSARAMHLEGSVQKVEKTHDKLKRQVLKASHEKIDKGMREGFAAASSKKKQKKASAA